MARLIRSWAIQYQKNGEISMSKRGKHQKIKSIINDEDVKMKIARYLRGNRFTLSINNFIKFICDEVFPSLGYERRKEINKDTARRWLNNMGWEYKSHQKDVYFDGHERPDVIEYRMKFLDQMKFFEKFMPIFEGEEMENIIWPALDLYEKIHILVTHDESTFYANDGIKKFWGPQGEQPLRPKSQGASLHISEFLCETIGRLCLGENEKQENYSLPEESRIPEEAV